MYYAFMLCYLIKNRIRKDGTSLYATTPFTKLKYTYIFDLIAITLSNW